MVVSNEIKRQILIDFIMYEKQGMSFYTEEDAKEYLKTYLSVIK